MRKLTLQNGTAVLIRPANKSDAGALVELADKMGGESDFLTFGRGEFSLTVEQEENYLANISQRNNAVYLVAEISGEIVGTLSFSGGSRPRTAHAGEFSLSVLKKYWGNGIGTALTECLIDWCGKTGIVRKINLRVRTDNYPAIHLYKKLGFSEAGTITREMLIDGVFYDALCLGYCVD
ncbi:MAG: GNAT family N-acetyltransferase [bacterium]|jgi:RimJ/RimL family protein N-acetyltransferase